ncbi:MAG: PQQ-binding-like beta-propeller repeat protein [Planctomycetota bacterium]|nr:PQQ-binding-like beta-propeller repeat protein [Planctomycetota bacterium]
MRRVCSPFVVIVVMAAAAAAQNAPRFEMLAGSSQTANLLQILRQEIEQGKAAQAAIRLEELLGKHADELAADDEAGVISVAAGVDAILAGTANAVATEFAALVDTAAKKALQTLRQDQTAGPQDYYTLARRYALSAAAGPAFAEAADHAAINGDAAAANCLYGLAKRSGWTPDPEHAATWAICRMLIADTGTDLPAEPGNRGAELAVKLAGYRGPAIFDATWYARSDAVGLAKFFPMACDGVLFFAGARHVLAIRETGQVVWRWTSGDAWTRGPLTDRGSDRGRGPSYAPAVFAGVAGAQILVTRQPRGVTEDSCLRAIRATDGKLLWTTEASRQFDRLSFAGNPAVAGRYVYAAAVDFADEAKLVLLAVDLLDGRLLFKTVLGNMLDLTRVREQRLAGWDDFWEQTEPAVASDALYLTPNVGVAFCVGRFDGKLRWERIYAPKDGGKVWRGNQAPLRVDRQTRLGRPVNPNELLRWRGTPVLCENVLVIAPQDTPGAWGLAANTGRVIWASPTPADWCLVGRSDTAAIFAGTAVAAVDAPTGKVKWRYEPMGGAKITGPVVIAGGAVSVPTTDHRVVTLSAETGKLTAGKVKVPGVRQILASPTAQRALEDAGIQ